MSLGLGVLLCSVMPAGAALKSSPALQEYGVPKIARFHGGADGAVSLQFDDSMISQLQNAIPLLKSHHLRATFFANPARPQYKAHIHEWEVDVLKAGHELGNHTLHHTGAHNPEEAEQEIGACSEVLTKIYGSKPRLMSFAQPGGVPWNVTSEQLAPIYKRHLLIPSLVRAFFDEKQTDPVTFAQGALDRHRWVQIGMHGTGGEWLSTSVPTLTRLLEFLSSHRETLWTAPTIEVYKYIQEREAAQPPVVSKATDRGFTLAIDCDPAKLETFGYPVATLYNQPLTVEVTVPSSWRKIKVRQGRSTARLETVSSGEGRTARFDVVPGAGPARVEKS